MRLILDALDRVGALDHDAKGPRFGAASTNYDDPLPYEAPDPAVVRWEAEQQSAFSVWAPDADVRVPSVKFSSNDYWLVFPTECRALQRAVSRVTDEVIQQVLEADPIEREAINDPNVDDPPDMATAIQNVEKRLRRFGEFCGRAADYGGFRIG